MEDEHPEWLPADWQVCVRVRTSGKKDKYYINPSNGIKFNSKPEVLRYLKNAGRDLKLKEPDNKQKHTSANSKQTVGKKLPSGWIKEIRITRKGGKTRRDPYYIDPVSGRHFRSMQEINRYLETKDSRKAESKGDDTDQTNELGLNSKSSITAKGHRLIDNKEDKILAGNGSIKSVAAVENANPRETDAIGQREKEEDSMAEDQQQEKAAAQNKRKKLNSKWVTGLPRRTSKRLAQVEADPSLEKNTSNGARGEARPSDEAEINTTKYIENLEIKSCRVFGKQEEPGNVPLTDKASVEEHDKEDEKGKRQLDSSLNDLLMDPCIEFAIKTLTGAIPIEDVNRVDDSPVASRASPNQPSGSSSALPFGNIWADPCFEFAVKMLTTSEIPMEADSHFQISFEQPLSSSGASGCNSVAK